MKKILSLSLLLTCLMMNPAVSYGMEEQIDTSTTAHSRFVANLRSMTNPTESESNIPGAQAEKIMNVIRGQSNLSIYFTTSDAQFIIYNERYERDEQDNVIKVPGALLQALVQHIQDQNGLATIIFRQDSGVGGAQEIRGLHIAKGSPHGTP
jgi:hypothetical protein